MKKLSHSIIFSGKISSGKSSVSKLIAQKLQIPRVSFGSYLKTICVEKGIYPSRKNLQDLGESLIKKDPKSILDSVLGSSEKLSDIMIIDGVRHIVILDLIENVSERTTTIFFDLDEGIRQNRYLNRNKNIDDVKSPELFKQHNMHSVEQDISQLKLRSDLIIDSDNPIEIVVNQVFDFISKSKEY